MPTRIYTDTEELMIARIYQSGISAREIGRVYGKSKTPILAALRRQGITQRSPANRNRLYPLNAHAFDVIDTEPKAYWLGFLYADGCTHFRSVTLALKVTDAVHVQAFANFMQSEAPVETRKVSGRYDTASLTLTDTHLVDRLRELGISTNRPDHRLTVNSIPPFLHHHFIRGLFDGDGSARTSPCMCFLGSLDLMLFVRESLATGAGTNPNLKPYQHTKSRHIYYLYYMRRPQSLRIAGYLYRDATIWLKRKRDVIDSWVASKPRERNELGRYR